ncbi:MAG: hypothetical protein ACLSDQ_12975 [Adlercreutzia equolifaciens]
MTDQQNPFSNMPEPPAAPDPAQAFDNAQCQGQAAQSYDVDQTAQEACDPYQAQAQRPYGAGQAYDPYQAQAQQQPYQQPYQATYEQPQPAYQQVYAQPVAPAAPAALYPMTDTDRNLRLVAFIFCILSLVGSCWLIVPLAWMIPMSVISWGIYKGTKANTVAFGVCTLIFCSLVAGILLLCSNKDR